MILSAVLVISVKNAVYSVLFLILSFVSASVLLFLLECEFVALIFITIYVGAIAVLFLFVVMMLDIKTSQFNKDSFRYFPFASLLGAVFLFEVSFVLSNSFTSNTYINSSFDNFYINWFDKIDSFTEIMSVGQVMYTQYVLQFLIAGNILLLATISAVVLTVNPNKTSNKNQIIYKQLARNYKNVLVLSR